MNAEDVHDDTLSEIEEQQVESLYLETILEPLYRSLAYESVASGRTEL